MKDAWAMQFVDGQMDRAWLDLRVQLADRLAAGLATGTQGERGETRAELVKLKHALKRALGGHAFPARPYRGEEA